MRRKRTFFDDEYGSELIVDVFSDGQADIVLPGDDPAIALSSGLRKALIRTLEAVPSE